MKLVPVIYYGFTGMDIRFSTPMLPWLVSEIRKRDYNEKLSLGIENGVLQAYNPDFELQFSHRIVQMIRFSQADLDPCTFLYLLRDDNEKTLYCYLYQALHLDDVSEIYKQMKEQSSTQNQQVKSNSTGSNLTSLCVDISPSSSNFFEVLYIGKIKVWNKKVPETFIDDALQKFKAHDLEKNKHKLLGNIGRLRSDDHIRRGSCDSTGSDNPTEPLLYPPLLRSQSTASHLGGKNLRLLMKQQEALKENSTSEDNTQQTKENNNTDRLPTVAKDTDDIDDNRTMVLQIDRTDLRLISPDRKVILLQKHHKDIATCVQALVSSEHFGFISKETSNTNNYIGYIFKCESASIASDAVAAIKQSFGNSEGKSKAIVTSCEHCPMIWFHKLCTEIEHLTDRKTYAAILRRIEQLDDEEQNTILTKFRGAQTDSLIEQNEFLMMLLRAHCEQKQGRHVHDTAENRSEFLNQYLGGGKIFMKAKRSLSNSFEILKKKASRDDFSATLREMNLPINNINRECSPAASIAEVSDHDSNGTRSRSSTIDSQSDAKEAMLRTKDKMKEVSPDQGLKSPMMDIFMKVGSTKSSTQEDSNDVKVDTGSWRQAIFKRVITPSNVQQQSSGKKTREELRELWKKSIHQAILLVRMEKENARIKGLQQLVKVIKRAPEKKFPSLYHLHERLKAQQEESAMKRIKLEYDEMKPNQREKMDIWELVTNKERAMKVDKLMLLSAIKQGIPRGKRGDAWQFLAEQYCARIPPVDLEKYPNYNTPYETLLKQLTSHQHAILIDLGRTFPNHSYFSSPLGPGQLALFNLLKAYSLLDPEVGYCQGLSFVVGVLLLHMEESQAFFLLRHLMFRRSLRKQYLPDMTGLQVRLYQLSRLLHDRIPEVYQHFDRHDVAPTLYAAPWLLTIFASQFPLGFVTRVYDLLFLEGLDIVFRVTLALLTHHKENLLKCDGFEEIMDYLKNTLPDIDKPTLDRIMKEVYNTDVTKQLNDYKVEYHVIQEEMASVQPQLDQLEKLQYENKKLKEKTKNLASQLDLTQSNAQRLEKTRTLQQAQLNKLEMNSRSLNVTIETLGSFINNLIEEKIDIEIPDDVQRILSQISVCEKRKSELKPQNSFMNLFKRSTTPPNKLMVKSLSTGKIPINTLLDQNVIRSNSLNTQTKQDMSEPNKPSFFSNNHSNILAQQKNVSPNLSMGSKIDITVQDFEETNHGSKDLIILESPTLSTDSGVGTPLSPRIDVGAPLNQKIIESLPPKKIEADAKIVEPSVHPLSNPDVNFTFNGTRELQNIKNLKNLARNSSPDLLRKQLS